MTAPRMFPIVIRPLGGERGAPGVRHQAIRCSQCPEEGLLNAHSRELPDDAAVKKFAIAGWLVANPGKHLCPKCHEVWRSRRRAGKQEQPMSTIVIPPASAKPVESEEARIRRAIPEIYVELEAAYDREAKSYRDGATDEMIAAKLNVPAAIVGERREKDFGPLVDPPAKRAREIGDMLRALLTQHGEAMRKMREHRSKMDAAFEEVETLGREIIRHMAQLSALFERA